MLPIVCTCVTPPLESRPGFTTETRALLLLPCWTHKQQQKRKRRQQQQPQQARFWLTQQKQMTPVERLKVLQLKWHHEQGRGAMSVPASAGVGAVFFVRWFGIAVGGRGRREVRPSFSEVFDWIDRLIVFLIGWIYAFDRQTGLV